MGQKIVVGPINKGLRNDVTPFNIDNDSFPVLINAYQWRSRIKRKRGTTLLGRLRRSIFSVTLTATGSGNNTIITDLFADTAIDLRSSEPNAQIQPLTFSITLGTAIFTDTLGTGILTVTGVGGINGVIDYNTGLVNIATTFNATGMAMVTSFSYYPVLPVMGLEDLILLVSQFPGTLAFDTKYSYNISTSSSYTIYDVSFYKNPATSGTYTAKSTWTPTTWNGEDYQQFWTVNYQGALWATNGITQPFSTTNIGMQFASSTTTPALTAAAWVNATTMTFTITGNPLVIGDFVFVNEFTGGSGLNWQTGYVTAAGDTFTVVFPSATIANAAYTPGMVQYLTNRSDTTLDGIRWYDGDPITVNGTFTNGKGWVNFAPPLSQSAYSIADLPAAVYYLVGAKMIVPFKDRLLFIGPVVQTSSGTPKYLQDTVIYSLNGTPYYTASYTNDPDPAIDTPTSITNVYNPLLVPENQTAFPPGWFEDSTGFGGFIEAGVDQPINTCESNGDVLIMGFSFLQTKFVYSGNDIVPFNFFLINSELGSSSTFSAINMGVGVLTRGSRGYVMTNQTGTERFDLSIPDEVFQVRLSDNGTERITAFRDYINEWVYFTYPSNTEIWKFPNQTLQYNYRDQSWAQFNESYTTYGLFRKVTGYTWATIGTIFPTWKSWNEAWNAGSSTLLQPQIIAGNQQGFVVFRDDGTNEANSLTITSILFPATITAATQANPAVLTVTNSFTAGQSVTISGVVGMTQLNGNTYTITAATPGSITINVNSLAFGAYISDGVATPTKTIYSPNHTLNEGDYIVISGVIGTISSAVNGIIFSVAQPDNNGFNLNVPLSTTGTYIGGGLIKRMYVPYIQSKQFPLAWDMGRKTRLGPQQYLLTTTSNAQVQLLIFLSQNADDPYNDGPIVPATNSINNALIYSTVLYTCPESANLGLTPANTNLQMISDINNAGTNASSPQSQIWHRVNTSLIGDTIQVGFSMSDAQMRDTTFTSQFAEIEIHGFILDANPGPLLA